jgi:hypothetical protein
MFEPTRAQTDKAEALALTAQSVAVTPPAAEGAPITVTVTAMPEEMGFTTRAPRVYNLTIAADGRTLMGVRA